MLLGSLWLRLNRNDTALARKVEFGASPASICLVEVKPHTAAHDPVPGDGYRIDAVQEKC